jgi:hypothetical protein
MKLFSKLKNFKSLFLIRGYKKEWEQITKPKILDRTQTLEKAENLIGKNKFLESIIMLLNLNQYYRNDREIEAKIQKLKKLVRDDVILRRYSIFKRYTSVFQEKSDVKRSFIFSFILFMIFFYICFGYPKKLSKSFLI